MDLWWLNNKRSPSRVYFEWMGRTLSLFSNYIWALMYRRKNRSRLNFGSERQLLIRTNYPYFQCMRSPLEDEVENIVYFHQR